MPSEAALAFVQAQAVQRNALGVDVPEIAPAGTAGADLRAGVPRETDGRAIESDGYNLKPGEPGYERAIAMNTRVLRRLKADGSIVELDDALVMTPLGATHPDEAPSSATAPGPSGTLSPVPTGTGKRALISFGPKEGVLCVTIEEGDEVLLSIQADIAAVRAFKPILSLVCRTKDMTGGALEVTTEAKPSKNGAAKKELVGASTD